MALIQKIAKLAHQTFSHINSTDRKVFMDGLTSLIAASNKIKKSDVGLTPEYLTQNGTHWLQNSREPPVTYIDIFENDVFTVGIFIVRQGACIPLHDHPGMYGIIKVLHGKLRIQSYTPTGLNHNSDEGLLLGEPFPAVKSAVVVVSEDDPPGVLTPSDVNLHEIRAVEGVAAFLDVLAPPYDSVHDCHYYEELTQDEATPHTHLVEIDPPRTYWSNSKPYLGPSIQSSEVEAAED